MRSNRVEIFQCVRPLLPKGHGSQHRTSGHSPSGRSDGLTLSAVYQLLITHHLHQCKLTLVVYQWPVGTFDSIMVNFLIGHYTYRMFPLAIPPPPSGELLIFCFLWLAIGNRNTDEGLESMSRGDSSIFYLCTFR